MNFHYKHKKTPTEIIESKSDEHKISVSDVVDMDI